MSGTKSLDSLSTERPIQHSLLSRCGILTAAVLGLWLVLAGPAYLVAGGDALMGLTCAAVLCTIPGWVVLTIASRMKEANQQATLVIVGGMGLRMFFVLIGMTAVQSVQPHLRMREFVVWLLVYYVATVALETVMVVSSLKRTQAQKSEPPRES